MPKLLSSVVVDRIVYDAVDRCCCPVTETLKPGTSYELLMDSDYLPSVCRVPCSIIIAKDRLYIVMSRALKNATNIAGEQF